MKKRDKWEEQGVAKERKIKRKEKVEGKGMKNREIERIEKKKGEEE